MKRAAPGIELDIAELVLHGFPKLDTERLRAALDGELGRLLRDEAQAARFRASAAHARIDAGSLRIGASATPEQIGVQLARAVVRSVQPGRAAAQVPAAQAPQPIAPQPIAPQSEAARPAASSGVRK